MAAGAGKSMLETPTWAVAAFCAIFVIFSVLIEHGIESLGKFFHRRQNKAMLKALEKIKAELMILGFISLLLTAATSHMAKICIPAKLEGSWVPCVIKGHDDGGGDGGDDGDDKRRKLLSSAISATKDILMWRRSLAAATTDDPGKTCGKDEIQLISYSAAHQLHLFLFILAVVHVLYSVILMALGQAKMKKWKHWELETASMEYQFTNDPTRFRFVHQTSFVKRHSGISDIPGSRWIVAFFRQFFGSISKVDYMTIRNGFINEHFAPNSKFDFHKYVKRCMEDDFKRVVGISIPLWVFTIILLLLNVHEWYTFTIVSFVPLLVLVLVGTKLELVIMEMAKQIEDRNTVVRGAPVVQPTNDFFWFNRPTWILFLIHFTLFENAFQMAYFLWSWYEFKSIYIKCMQEKSFAVLLRVILGVALHILCSYITFPLYALVTQMGSHMKTSIFKEQTTNALKKWQKAAKERKKLGKIHGGGGAATASIDTSSITTAGGGFMSPDTSPSQGTSPIHLLQNYKYRSTTNNKNNYYSKGDGESESIPVSPRTTTPYDSEVELSEIEDTTSPNNHLPSRPNHHPHHASDNHDGNSNGSTTIDFTFVHP